MNRRTFLRGLTVATAAGILVPERKIWALDRTMMFDTRYPEAIVHFDEAAYIPSDLRFTMSFLRDGDETVLLGYGLYDANDPTWGAWPGWLECIRAYDTPLINDGKIEWGWSIADRM